MKHYTDAEMRLGFRIHAAAYAVLMLLLVVVNLLTGPPYWVVWVFPGWTVGLLCHWYFGSGRAPRSA